ncbi:MAG: response regulator [Alphaproteobacteria bacterium]|nr:MAG: response regulator [Alphaproteobacteria bacterium]
MTVILAVDDDPAIGHLLNEILSAFGYKSTTVANSATEALRLIASGAVSPDVILLDIQMPEMDGIELCRRIRAIPKHSKTPIVMLTAMAEKSYVEDAFLAGATDYVTKPFDPMALVSRVRVAAMLAEEQKKASQVAVSPSSARTVEHADFAHPFVIDEIPGVVAANVLCNFIEQMRRIERMGLVAFAINVPQSAQICARVTRAQYESFVTDLAAEIMEVLVSARAFIAHMGRGTFVAVAPKSRVPDRGTIIDSLRAAINDPDRVYSDGTRDVLDVELGQFVSPALISRESGAELLERAVAKLNRLDLATNRSTLNVA